MKLLTGFVSFRGGAGFSGGLKLKAKRMQTSGLVRNSFAPEEGAVMMSAMAMPAMSPAVTEV